VGSREIKMIVTKNGNKYLLWKVLFYDSENIIICYKSFSLIISIQNRSKLFDVMHKNINIKLYSFICDILTQRTIFGSN